MEGEDCQRCWSSDPSLHVHLPEAAGCVHRRKVWEVTLCMYRQLGPVENRMRVRSHTVHSELSGFSTLVVECHELPEEGTWWSLEGWARLGPCRGGWTAHGLSTRTKASRRAGLVQRLVQERDRLQGREALGRLGGCFASLWTPLHVGD